MKRLIVLFFLIFSLISFAKTPKQIFEEANNNYQAQEYSSAVDNYENLLGKGYQSAEIYYNLGNAYFKLNDIPSAILYYEKAKKIAPGDEDIDFNLRIANLQTVDKIEPLPKLFYQEWYESLSRGISSGKWAFIAITCSFISVILLVIFVMIDNSFIKKASFAVGIISIIIMILSIIIGFDAHSYNTKSDTAIIFAESIYVKSSPDGESTKLFMLHEGTKVEIIDDVGEWYEIKIANGNVGWLPINAIQKI